jgi:hypothetical protein
MSNSVIGRKFHGFTARNIRIPIRHLSAAFPVQFKRNKPDCIRFIVRKLVLKETGCILSNDFLGQVLVQVT